MRAIDVARLSVFTMRDVWKYCLRTIRGSEKITERLCITGPSVVKSSRLCGRTNNEAWMLALYRRIVTLT